MAPSRQAAASGNNRSTRPSAFARPGGHDGVDVLVRAHVVDGAGERPQEGIVVAVRGRAVEDDDAHATLLLQPHRHLTPSQTAPATNTFIIEGAAEGAVALNTPRW